MTLRILRRLLVYTDISKSFPSFLLIRNIHFYYISLETNTLTVLDACGGQTMSRYEETDIAISHNHGIIFDSNVRYDRIWYGDSAPCSCVYKVLYAEPRTILRPMEEE